MVGELVAIRVSKANGTPGFVVTADDGRDVLIQNDYDFPSLAETFGWYMGTVPVEGADDVMFCPSGHSDTDGTIDCATCGTTAAYLIDAARAYLTDNLDWFQTDDFLDGSSVSDPGYFTEGEG